MHTIVTASQKGGSGKTTLSGHLAVEAERAGAGPVALVDTDPQGSLSQWWNARQADTPLFVRAGLTDLGNTLAKLDASGVRLTIIDTPPAITDSISYVVGFADLVIVPTRPSPHDLRAVGATVDIAERHTKPLIFVLNEASARARITGESAVALSQHGTVAPITIHHRVDFAASMIDGRTVSEVVPSSASAREIAELWLYVQARLCKLTRDPSLIPDFRPEHFAVNALMAESDDEEDDQAISPAPAVLEPLPPIPVYSGPERRVNPPNAPYGGVERRAVFGRRRVSFS